MCHVMVLLQDVAGRDEAMESEVRVQVLQTGDSCVRVLQTAAPAKQVPLPTQPLKAVQLRQCFHGYRSPL